jgi:phosphosulfolactate synthase
MEVAADRGLGVQFELGKKHSGAFDAGAVDELIEQGETWLKAGARELVVEARESADAVGLFGAGGEFNSDLADRFADAFGLDNVTFEAPNKASQFTLLSHFGPRVRLCNVRLEELLRVEIYRRGLHSDSFSIEHLRPGQVLA